MPERSVKNPVASIVARLKNEAVALGLTSEQLRVMPLQMAYAHQGFLARLDVSRHAERFVVKGGASLFARYRALGRPTRDLDLASAGPAASLEEIRGWIEEICSQPFGDHLTFSTDELQVNALTPDSAAHPVIAVRLTAHLGGSRQIVDLDPLLRECHLPWRLRDDLPAAGDPTGRPDARLSTRTDHCREIRRYDRAERGEYPDERLP